MKVLWICGLPNEVRLNGYSEVLSPEVTPAWSWILGHLPTPQSVELHVLCPVVGLITSQIHFEYLGVCWHCFDRSPLHNIVRTINYFLRVKRFINKLNPDVIHGWGGETGFGFAATLFRKPAVVSVQGLLRLLCMSSESFDAKFRTFWGRCVICREEKAYHRAKACLVESEASRRALKDYYGEEGIYVPHPLRGEFLNADIASRQGLAGRPIKFVFVGSLLDRKGALDAVMAFVPYAKAGARLLYIGSGPQQHDIEAVIHNFRLNKSVVIHNMLTPKQIVNEFSDAQFFLLPSYCDTGPTALKEALACGLYPICYDNSGPKDLIVRYRCGRLVKTGSQESLSEAIGLCIRDVKNCIMLGLCAADRVRSELSRDYVWGCLWNVYNEVLK